MKRTVLAIITILFAFGIGVYLTRNISTYFIYPNLKGNEYLYNGTTWQDEESSCGKPSKSIRFNVEAAPIIDNPLCRYSANLHEIPTVDYDELARFPAFYNEKIIRVKGRFNIELNDPYLGKSRLFMMSHNSSQEQPIEFNSPWDWNITTKLRNFIETNAMQTKSANVSLIITFLDASDNPAVLEISNNNPLQMCVLHIEEMKVVSLRNEKK